MDQSNPFMYTAPENLPGGTNGTILTQTNGSQNNTPWVKWSLIVVALMVMVGSTSAVVYMIGQSTYNVSRAMQQRNDEIVSLLDDTGSPGTSFALVGKVQAAYENPFDEDTSYTNPFDGYENPFE